MDNDKPAPSYSVQRARYLEYAGIAFDRAVAISYNGRRVRHANHVVVYRRQREDLLIARFLGALFHMNKVRLDACHVIQRQTSGKKEYILRDELAPAMIGQYLFKAQPKLQVMLIMGKLRVFVTPADTIPDVLKEVLMHISEEARTVFRVASDEHESLGPLTPRPLEPRHGGCTGGNFCYCAPFDDSGDPSSPRP